MFSRKEVIKNALLSFSVLVAVSVGGMMFVPARSAKAEPPPPPPAAGEVPVGTILAYIGPLTTVLPQNWVLCDGRLVIDPQSPFNNRRIPDLTNDRFLMGVAANGPVAAPGGSNTIDLGGGHNHGGKTIGFAGYQAGEINYDRQQGHQDQYGIQLRIDTDGGHNHGGDKRPAYLGVFYIIRIK